MGPYFLQAAEDASIGLALLGLEARVRGEGELFRVRFPSGVTPGLPELLCRSTANAPLEFQLDETAIAELPTRYRLVGSFPNPFNPKTAIRFDLVDAQSVRLTIFDMGGRLVRTLVDGQLAAGEHSVIWDGRDETGQSVSSGVYLYRIDAGPLRETAKMLLLK